MPFFTSPTVFHCHFDILVPGYPANGIGIAIFMDAAVKDALIAYHSISLKNNVILGSRQAVLLVQLFYSFKIIPCCLGKGNLPLPGSGLGMFYYLISISFQSVIRFFSIFYSDRMQSCLIFRRGRWNASWTGCLQRWGCRSEIMGTTVTGSFLPQKYTWTMRWISSWSGCCYSTAQ